MRAPIRIEPIADDGVSTLPAELGFGRVFTARMFTQHYTLERGWQDALIGPYHPLALDPATQIFHCGQMIFEGTKAYRRSDGDVNLFRVSENVERFNRSADRLAMPKVPAAAHIHAITELVRLEQEWIPHQPGAALYIRPVMIATDVTLEVRASRTFLHYIVLSPVSAYFAGGFNPVSVFISHKHVRAVRGGTGEAKTAANYAISLLPAELARSQNYQQVLWLDGVEQRYVEEVGAMNIAFVYAGKHIRTPLLSGSILPGVTRSSLIRLARDSGYTVSEDRIDVAEMLLDLERGRITEVFSMGTAAVIAPIGKLGYRGRDFVVNNFETGPVAKHLYRGLTDIQYGRCPDPYGWIQKIPVADTGTKTLATPAAAG